MTDNDPSLRLAWHRLDNSIPSCGWQEPWPGNLLKNDPDAIGKPIMTRGCGSRLTRLDVGPMRFAPVEALLRVVVISSIFHLPVDTGHGLGPENGAARSTPHESKQRVRFVSSPLDARGPSPRASTASVARPLCIRIRCSRLSLRNVVSGVNVGSQGGKSSSAVISGDGGRCHA